jgi:amino acid adenylation domain-containing protein
LRVAYQDIAVADRLAPADTLPGAFERAVEAHRSRIAVRSATWTASYDEFNATANRLAHALLRRGAEPGDRVAILMEHDTPEVAALIGVLKTGCMALVLNASHPPARLRQLIDDAEPAQIVSDRQNLDLAREIAGRRCEIVGFEDEGAHGPTGNPGIARSPRDAAVLVYTSGSTGTPKGVMQTHAQRLRVTGVHTTSLEVTSADRMPLLVPLAHGQSNGTALVALLNGATLLPFPVAQKGVTGLFEWMNRERITVYISSASIFRNFMNTVPEGARLPHVHAIRVASESATSDDFKLFQQHFPDTCVFVHTFSCTETSTLGVLRMQPGDPVPDGRLPVRVIDQGQTVSLRDEQGRPVPVGEVGEITVRSANLSGGYWRNPEMNAERFLPPDESGDSAYRTGDLARLDSAGFLHFVGRTGTRIKIRGIRIELAEVSQAIGRLPGVAQAVADVVERPPHEPLLIGYVVPHKDHSLTPARLRRELRNILPDQAVPSVIVVLDHFPLTPNGKIDRERLRQLRPQRLDTSEPPQTATETLLADLWADVFAIASVGRTDSFFELGGDSLIAAVVAARVHDRTGVELNLGAFADHPTLAELADVIDRQGQEGTADETPLVRVPRTEPLPLSFAQEQAWLASQTPGGLQGYIHANRYRIVGPLDKDALHDCLSYLVRRHETLRTTFTTQNGQPVQIVHAPQPAALAFFDLAGTPDAEERADEILREQAARPLDLTRLPIVHFSLVRVREEEHWLQRVIHHVTSDSWAGHMLFDELALLYDAKRRGEPPPLRDALDLQYADYAAWERTVWRSDGPTFRDAIDWWKDTLGKPAPELRLPCRRPRTALTYHAWTLWRRLGLRLGLPTPPELLSPTDGVIISEIDRGVAQRLDDLGRKEGATPYLLRLAAFVALLADETGEDDILIGTYTSNRKRLALQSIYGSFANLLALRFRYRPDMTFRDWLASVREHMTAAEARSTIPFGMLGDELVRQGLRRPQLGVFFQLSSQGGSIREFADLKMTSLQGLWKSMPRDFHMNPVERAGRYYSVVSFDAYRYDPAGVHVLIDRYQRLLDTASRHPDMTLHELLAMSRAGGGLAH